MIDISALDNVIAVVVVLLLLSLIVQSIQSVLKKALKIKSRQIEDSLIDLFENVLNYNPTAEQPPRELGGKIGAWLVRVFSASPLLRAIYKFFRRKAHPADPVSHPDDNVKKLFDAVMKGFKDVGRVAQTGKPMLDSISKEDLKKVMGKVFPETLLTGFKAKLTTACNTIVSLETTIKTINDEYLANLSGDSNAKFAALQQALTPLLNDLRAIFNGQQLSSSLIIEDVVRLREVDLTEVLEILGELQKKVTADLNTARQAQTSGTPPAAGVITSLEGLSGALGDISMALTKLTAGLDTAIAPLRTKLNEVETWYDTVTQSFEERYTRGMKTWAIVISFLVVAYLNASVFDIYKTVATNDAMRNQLVQIGEERTKANEQRRAKAKADQAQAKTEQEQATTADAKKKAEETADQAKVTLEEIDRDTKEIREQIESLSSFGFHPLTWQSVKARFNHDLWWTHLNEGETVPTKEKNWDGWFNRRKDDLKTIVGWIVMTFLLSVGAPFWQDTLESLFGVKNLLRKKSDTKNVEAKSGAGQPRT